MADPFDTFTEPARHVLALAQQEAQRFRHNYIGTEHFLLGLIGEEDGTAARLLINRGIDLAMIRGALQALVGRGQTVPKGAIGLTPRAKRMIELAVDESRLLNHRFVGTQHLLLGIIREGQGLGVQTLSQLGLDLSELRTALLNLDEVGPDAQGRWPESGPEYSVELRQALADLAALREQEQRLRRRIGELVQAEQRNNRQQI